MLEEQTSKGGSDIQTCRLVVTSQMLPVDDGRVLVRPMYIKACIICSVLKGREKQEEPVYGRKAGVHVNKVVTSGKAMAPAEAGGFNLVSQKYDDNMRMYI